MNRSTCFFFFSMLLSFSLFAKEMVFPTPDQVITLTDLTMDDVNEVATGKRPDIVVECKKGTEIPLQFLLKVKHFSLNCIPNIAFKTDQNCYLRYSKNKMYVSYDLIHWQKAKKVFNGKAIPNFKFNQDRLVASVEIEEAPEKDHEWNPYY